MKYKREFLSVISVLVFLISACTPIQATNTQTIPEEFTATEEIFPTPEVDQPTKTPISEPQTTSNEMIILRIVGEKGLSIEEITERVKKGFEEAIGLALNKAFLINATEAGQENKVVMAITTLLTNEETGQVVGGGQLFVKEDEATRWSKQLLTFTQFEITDQTAEEQRFLGDYQSNLVDKGLVRDIAPGTPLSRIEFMIGADETGPKIQFQRLWFIDAETGDSQMVVLMGVPDQSNPEIWYQVDSSTLSQENLALIEGRVVNANWREVEAEPTSSLGEEATLGLPDRIVDFLRAQVEKGQQPALVASANQILDFESGERLAWMDENGDWWLMNEDGTTTEEATPSVDSPETGIAKPDQSFAEFVPEDSPLRGAFFELMRTQFADGGLEKSSGNTYSLACIASEDIHYHQNNIELPDGYIVTHSIPCQYYDAQGEEQVVYLPAVIFNLEQGSYQFLGRQPVIDMHAAIRRYNAWNGAFSDDGPINIYKSKDGYVGKGHPITLTFSSDLEENFSMPQDLLSALITSEDFTNFAQDGSPEHLPAQLLWTRETGLKNNNFPKEPLD
jgi:hypothetical protein